MQRIINKAVKSCAAVFTGLLLFTACEPEKETSLHSEHKKVDTMKEHAHNHDHAHHAHAGSEKKYNVTYRSEPAQIEAGKPAKLYFKPEEDGNANSNVALDKVHEMNVHLFIISKDLSSFAHEHPETVTDGSYVWEHTFPAAGDYLLFQDYTPAGAGHQLGRHEIKVSGENGRKADLGEENLTWEGSGYNVTLSSEQPLKTNASIEVKATVSKNGKPVTDLNNYLGALAHVVILSEDAKEFVHVHPMESKTSGPDIMLHTKFPKPGKYKVFMQFKHENKVNTADFILNVV